MSRARLPNRREHETRDFKFRGVAFTCGIGRFENGDVAEIFLACSKSESQIADDARDAAICASLALQHGVPLETIRSAVARDAQDGPAGILGAVLDAIAEGARS